MQTFKEFQAPVTSVFLVYEIPEDGCIMHQQMLNVM